MVSIYKFNNVINLVLLNFDLYLQSLVYSVNKHLYIFKNFYSF